VNVKSIDTKVNVEKHKIIKTGNAGRLNVKIVILHFETIQIFVLLRSTTETIQYTRALSGVKQAQVHLHYLQLL